jgi:predicted secreted hydrolase
MDRLHTLVIVFALALAGCAPRVVDVPYPVVPVELPRDDAAHLAPVEWWYWVGHVVTEDGRRFGFQLTFFEAYLPPSYRLAGVLPLRYLIEKGFVAHAAIADLDAGRHHMAQRDDTTFRAGASYDDLDVFVGGWRASRAQDGVGHALTFEVGGYALDLVLDPTKPATLHGDPPGVQSMGPGGVSYYVSHTRMDVSGSLRGPCALPRACAATAVEGRAWFDHQWGDFRIDLFGGWDWFALQFDDGADLMLYLIRGEDGAVASSAGTYVTADGRSVPLEEEDFVLEPTGSTWTSPATGATYPAGWRVRVTAHDVDVEVVPLVADQEMDTRATTRIVYWEGAVEVRGERPGVGFVELTNYDRVPIAASSR